MSLPISIGELALPDVRTTGPSKQERRPVDWRPVVVLGVSGALAALIVARGGRRA